MTEQQTEPQLQRRRRRRREGRGGDGAEAAPRAKKRPAQQPAAPDWQWRTFPVFLAFALGMLVMGFVGVDPLLSVVFFIGALLAVAFGVAHVLTRQVIARRRRR